MSCKQAIILAVLGSLFFAPGRLSAAQEEPAAKQKTTAANGNEVPAAWKEVLTKTYSLEFKEVTWAAALDHLRQATGVNIVGAGEAEMKVSLTFKEEPLREIIAALAKVVDRKVEYGAENILIRPFAAKEALARNVSFHFEGIPLREALNLCAERGIQYVTSEITLAAEVRLFIRVSNVPLREVIETVAYAANLECKISASGIVALKLNAAETERRNRTRRWRGMRERMERFGGFGRQQRERGHPQRRPRPDDKDEKKKPPRRPEEREDAF